MWNKYKKLLALNKDDLYLCAGVMGGLFLLIQIIIGIVMAAAKPTEGVQISAFVLCICSPFLIFAVTLSHFLVTYPQTIQFGCIRRRGMLLAAGLVGVDYLATVLICVLDALVETRLCPGLWRALAGIPAGADFRMDVAVAPPWWALLAVPLAGVAAGLILAAVLHKFGRAGGWAIWTVWMVAIIGQSFLPWKESWFSLSWLIPLLLVILAAACVWSVWILLRMEIKA